MIKTKSIFISISIFFLGITLPGESWACRCVELTTKDAFIKSCKVVLSNVIKIETIGDGKKKIELLIKKTWKQDSVQRITVYQEPHSCAFSYTLNKNYLLFLNDNNGQLYTTKCSGSKEISNAEQDFKWLEKYSETKKILINQH